MIVIADAGSTKTDWRIVKNPATITTLTTIGFNPVLTNTELIISELQQSFIKKNINHSVNTVYYYGAGCWNEGACLIVERALEVIFPNATINVKNDLLGAARSVCGQEAGIACILGTGANSCLYDGTTILDNVPPLGFIVGDEGSGAYLGKSLLQSYFYRELPLVLKEKLDQQYDISKKNLLEKVYQNKGGNQYLATFAKFIIAEKAHPFIENLIKEAFTIFIKRQVLKYQHVEQLPIHFIGSIAFFLAAILKKVVADHQLTLGNIIRQPIDGLVEFHVQKR